jgi:hypothetical protein
VPDAGPVEQHNDAAPYLAAADRLRRAGLVHACDCTRSTFAGWAVSHGGPWCGPGCPGGCRERARGAVADAPRGAGARPGGVGRPDPWPASRGAGPRR